jgi:hypothetical protein
MILTLFVICFVVGLLSVIKGRGGKPIVKIYQKYQNALFDTFVVPVGVLVTKLFNMVFCLVENPGNDSVLLSLSGQWEYISKSSLDNSEYGGECNVEQQGRKFRLCGSRKWVTTNSIKKSTSDSWQSRWGYICGNEGDYTILFEFEFLMDGETIIGYCNLTPKNGKLDGRYYMLSTRHPDFKGNCGNSTFTQLDNAQIETKLRRSIPNRAKLVS